MLRFNFLQSPRSIFWALGFIFFVKALLLPLNCIAEDLNEVKMAILAKDYPAAVHLLQELVKENNPEAQYQLAVLYRLGTGVEKNPRQAATLLEKSAFLNFSKAQYHLGVMYENGLGVEKSIETARQWYRLAASQGHTMAKAKLGEGDNQGRRRSDPVIVNIDKESAIRLAIRKAQFAQVEQGLAQGIDINSINVFGKSLLMEATEAGALKITKMLLSKGADSKLRDKFGNDAMTLAVKGNHFKSLAAILEYDLSSIDAVDKNGNTLLIFSAHRGHMESVKVLLQYKANIHLKNKKKWTALMAAKQRGYKKIVNLLLSHGATKPVKEKKEKRDVTLMLSDVNRLANDDVAYTDWSLLSIAVWRGKQALVKSLLAKNPDLELEDEDGHTALSRAAWRGRNAIIHQLIDAGARVNHPQKNAYTPLIWAVEAGHGESAEILLNAGADMRVGKISALQIALINNQSRIARRLVQSGADVNFASTEGVNMLMLASRQGDVLTMKALLKGGAKINAKTKKGQTALWMAADAEQPLALRYLLENHASINLKSKSGEGVLFVSVRRDNPELVRLLLAKGADVNAVIDQNNTVLMLAANQNSADIAEQLIAAGAALDEKNMLGNTALIIAVRSGYTDVVRVLLDAGANYRLRNKKRERAHDLAKSGGYQEIDDLIENKKSSNSRFFGLF